MKCPKCQTENNIYTVAIFKVLLRTRVENDTLYIPEVLHRTSTNSFSYALPDDDIQLMTVPFTESSKIDNCYCSNCGHYWQP